jgi:hypothetical protein
VRVGKRERERERQREGGTEREGQRERERAKTEKERVRERDRETQWREEAGRRETEGRKNNAQFACKPHLSYPHAPARPASIVQKQSDDWSDLLQACPDFVIVLPEGLWLVVPQEGLFRLRVQVGQNLTGENASHWTYY